MKKVTLSILLMLALAVTPLAAQAQSVEYPVELEYYDAQIAVFLPRLDDFQYQYHVTNGRYYQALTSHASAPDVPTVPDGIAVSPTDQPETLAYLWQYAGLPDALAWSLRVDTYSGPQGDGYVLSVETVVSGGTWKRSVNFGPDAWRGADWYLVTEE